ncbi:MAG TPA: hypothetical protein GXX46_13195, partial [Peptococcaceae bacterium]|nr:hypothetical protein [Peptococcaceae bacterium]
INLVGNSNYVIIINDTGTGERDKDILIINATANNDQILIRHNFIALINNGVDHDGDGYADVERINYYNNPTFDEDTQTWLGCTLEEIIINTLAGDDHVLVDDTSTKFTINGGEGNDKFQIGQVFNSPRDAEAGVAPEDRFETVRTTQGYLSRGISFGMEIFGGKGNDEFLIYHNKAELTVHGEDGDDKFLVRAFVVIDGSGAQDNTNIETGDGNNEITYALNAPVNIDGGSGRNVLIVLLTEYDDQVVITEDKIYGAGRTVKYVNIQRLEIDGLAGDDVFYVLSTAEGVETILIGGLGSDTFIIGGDVPHNVIKDENGNYINDFTSPHDTRTIKGKLITIGGTVEGTDHSLAEAVTLPTETNQYIPTGEVTTSTGNTITDESTDFSGVFSGNIENYFVGILDEFGRITQIRRIESWEGHTLTLDKPWDELLAPGTKYVILPTSPTLFVDESTQTDIVKVYNDGSSTPDTGTLTENKLTGLNMVEEGIKYTEIEKMFIYLGQGKDTFNIQNTSSGTYTEIHGNDGEDIFNIISTGDELVIHGGNDNDKFNINFIRDNLTVYGDSGNDEFNVAFNEFSEGNVHLNGGTGNDTFNVNSNATGISLVINGDEDNDTFNLEKTKDNSVFNGGSGNDLFKIIFAAPVPKYLTLNGDAGDDIFRFADGVVLIGEINGGQGDDTLDFLYYDYSTARHVYIEGWNNNEGYSGTQEAISNGFTGITRIIGSRVTGNDGDKLYGIVDQPGEWVLDGNNSYYKVVGAEVSLNFINYDLLYGGEKDDSFTITGEEYGRLYGGPGNDIFIMLDGATLDGNIDGGGGNNTLDYRTYTSDIYVNLSEFKATGISNSIVGIHNVFGGLGDDHIIGDNGDNILGSNGGNDILEGRYGNNIYMIFEGFGTVRIIETLLGEDTLDFSNVTSDLNWNLKEKTVNSLAQDGETVVGTVIYGALDGEKQTQGDRIKTLIGGQGKTRFVFTDGYRLPSGTRIDGGVGTGILDFSNYGQVSDVRLTGIDTEGFSGEQAAIPGGFVNIKQIIGNVGTTNTLRGTDADSTFTFAKVLDGTTGKYVDLYTFTMKGITDVALVFENFQHLISGNGDDTFKFVNGGSFTGTLDGGAGTNWLDYSEYYPIYKNEDDNDDTDNGNNGKEQEENTGVTVDLAANLIPGLTGTLLRVKNIIGSPYDDILLGDNSPNILIGGQGKDRLEGRGGYNTYIFAEDWGEDTVLNSSGQGALDFSTIDKDLTLHLEGLNTVRYANNLVTFEGISLIKTGSGNDRINISGNYNVDIDSGDGEDTFNFGTGAAYNGRIEAGAGDDIFNIAGDALVRGQLNGGLGDDTYNFLDSAKVLGTIDGGEGLNILNFNGYGSSITVRLAAWQVANQAGTVLNKFNNIQKLIGSDINGENDTIVGSNENTTFTVTGNNEGEISWSANDPTTGQTINYVLEFSAIENLTGGSGNDTFAFTATGYLTGNINGGAGNNWLDYSGYHDGEGKGVTVDLSQGLIQGLGGSLTAVNNILGSNYDDTLIGNLENNIINGGAGDDIIKGVGGNNTIIGGAGNDHLYGGSGTDTFVFEEDWGQDTLYDYENANGETTGKGRYTLDFSSLVSDLTLVLDKNDLGKTTLLITDAANWEDPAQLANANWINYESSFPEVLKAVYTGEGNDTFILKADSKASLYGGAGDDTFRVGAVTSAALYGGEGDDKFIFLDKAKLNSTIDGGSGDNTLDLREYTANLQISLTALGETVGFKGTLEVLTSEDNLENLLSGFNNITVLLSGQGTDTLRGLNAEASFILDNNARYLSGGRTLYFSAIETLRGGSGNDRFEIHGEQQYDLYGGAGNDIFIFLDNAKLNGTMDGEGGNNTIDLSAYTADLQITLTGLGETVGFKGNLESLLTDFNNITVLKSGQGRDTLRGLDAEASFILDNNARYLSGNRTLYFDGIEILRGGSGNDRFEIHGEQTYDLYGGAGNDTFVFLNQAKLTGRIDGQEGENTLDYSAYITPIEIILIG